MGSVITEQNFTISEGDDIDIIIKITDENDNVVDLTGYTASWVVAKSSNSSTKLIEKATGGSDITISTPSEGKVRIRLDSNDTDGLCGLYYHELQIKDNTSKDSTVAWGYISIKRTLI